MNKRVHVQYTLNKSFAKKTSNRRPLLQTASNNEYNNISF